MSSSHPQPPQTRALSSGYVAVEEDYGLPTSPGGFASASASERFFSAHSSTSSSIGAAGSAERPPSAARSTSSSPTGIGVSGSSSTPHNSNVHDDEYQIHDDQHDPNRHIILQLIDYVRYRSVKKKILTVVVIVVAVLVFADLWILQTGYIRSAMEGFFDMLNEHSVEALLSFVAIFVLTTLIFIPPTLMTFGGGFVFARVYGEGYGFFIGALACFIGSSLGALLAFVRARYMMRDLILLFARKYPIIRAADKALKRDGFRIMLLLRLCSIIPYNALNYIGGVTGVKWESFTLSLVGGLPSQLLTVAIGVTAGSLTATEGSLDHQTMHLVLMCTGIGFGIVAIVITLYFARKELRKELEMSEKEMDNVLHGVLITDSVSEEEGIEAQYVGKHDEEWFWVWS